MVVSWAIGWKLTKSIRDWGSAAWRRGKQIATLEERITKLEALLNGPHPPDVCKACGQRGVRQYKTEVSGTGNHIVQHWRCALCAYEEIRLGYPS
jgi:hypothetical protein